MHISQKTEHLASWNNVLNSILNTTYTKTALQTSQAVGDNTKEVQGHLQVHREFEAKQNYLKLHLKKFQRKNIKVQHSNKKKLHGK